MKVLQHLYFIVLFSPGFALGPLSLKFFIFPILSIIFAFSVTKSLKFPKILIIYLTILFSIPILGLMQNYLVKNDQFRPSLYMNAYFYFNICYALIGTYIYRSSTTLRKSLLYSALIVFLFLLFDVLKVDYSIFSDAPPTWKDYTDRGRIYRPGGLSGDPNRAAISLIVIFIILFYLNHNKKLLNYSVVMLGFLTQSRTFVVSFILVLFRKTKVVHSLVVLAIIMPCLYILMQPIINSFIYHSSMLSRYRYWGNLRDFDWISIFGNGLGSSLYVSLPYQYGPLHNSWMTVFFELGVTGLILYMVSLYQTCRRERLVIMLLPFTLTIDFMYSQVFWFLIFFLLLKQEKRFEVFP